MQELLVRLTGLNFERVFARRKEPLTAPQYKLMSMEELREVQPSPSFLLSSAVWGTVVLRSATT